MIKQHVCASSRVHWAAYDSEKSILYISFKPKGTVYAYADVPEQVYENLLTAKASTPKPTETTRGPIGIEVPGSEGSYLICHVIGKDRNNPPYKFRKLADEESAELIERFPNVGATAE